MIKMIATDIDGTILKYNFEFNKEVKECIKRLNDSGVKVVLVTGRMHSAALDIAEQLGLDTPIVSCQGSLIKFHDEVLYERSLDVNRAREIINWTKANDIHLNLYMNEKLYVEKDDEIIRRYTRERKSDFNVVSFDDIVLDKINKMLIIDFENYDKVTEYRDYLSKKYPDVDFVKSMPFFCEITHPEATKYHSVKFLTEYYGLKQDEVMTIGDQDNDINLLKAGGVKVAMGNATDSLKAVANHITDTVNNNGFVKAVEKFVGVEYAAKL